MIHTNVINIYCVYKLDPIASSGDTTFTIQNALFGAMKITKNADNSKNNYKGYGICFDERSEFGHTITEGGFAHTTDARNVLIFEADMSFSVHATNRANNIYIMGTGLTKGIHDMIPPYKSSSNNIKVKLDLANYATKDDVKKVEDKVNETKKEIIFVRGFFFFL